MALTSEHAVSDRMAAIPPYPFVSLANRVHQLRSEGHPIIRLDVGSPDLPPPPAVTEALIRSVSDPTHHGYAGYTGIPALRVAISHYYERRFGVDLDSNTEVIPLIGSKEGIVNLSLALLNPGDVVLVPEPGYTAYDGGARLAGAEPYRVPLDAGNNFMPALDSVADEILARTRMLWINYPNNPTGAVATLEQLTQIVEFCREHDILLCSDNPYSDITFDGRTAHSILEVSGARDISVEFNSLSKTYNMAGWRVGMCVGNASMVTALRLVKSNVDSGLFRAIQDAAIAALTEVEPDWLKARNAVYQQRRDVVIDALSSCGLRADPPHGALYIWANVEHGDDVRYAANALERGYVSIAPGSMYGPSAAGYVRLSLVQEASKLLEAVSRLNELWMSDSL